ncbi:MAG: flagellar export chaperone FliS [Candidatus Sumerlaeia bacterium]
MTGYQNYARTNIQTSDPRAVVVLLYEGGIKFLGQAREALAGGDRQEMSRLLQKTQKIILFLSNALDFDAGGEIAVNLDKLYAYIRDILNEANYKADGEKIEEAIQLLKPLLEAWREIAKDPTAAAALEKRSAQATAGIRTPQAPEGEAYGDESTSKDLNEQAQADRSDSEDDSAQSSANLAAGRAAYGINHVG